jgi:CheY-like chemotaxis protein
MVVLNNDAETIGTVKTWFEAQGMLVRGAKVTAFQTGERNLASFVAAATPDVIVFDVALPYVANWQHLHDLRADERLWGIPIIVTTPNAEVLRTVAAVCNPGVTHQILSKPANLQELTAKVIREIGLGV